MGTHMAPFFAAVTDAMTLGSDGSPATKRILLMALVRAVAIAGCVAAVYAVAQLVNVAFGREIVVEDEIVVIEDDDGGDGNDNDNNIDERQRAIDHEGDSQNGAVKRRRRKVRAKKEQ